MADSTGGFGESPFPVSTIDESVGETIMRDVRQVIRRLGLVVMPGSSSDSLRAELRDWELWGPLFICMSLAIMLSIESVGEDASLVFSVIFFVVWVGAAVITVNAQLLGGKLSFFQTLCLLGYCVFPVLLAAIACFVINQVITGGLAVLLRFIAATIGLLWSLWASSSFMADARFPEGKRVLALYPVLLFYAGLSWMVIIGFQTSGPGGGKSDGSSDEGSGETKEPDTPPAPEPKEPAEGKAGNN